MLGNEADQSNEANLRIDIHTGCPNHAKEVQWQECAEHRRRQGNENNERIAEALELRRKHQENHDKREDECRDKRIPFFYKLPTFPLVVDTVTLRQDLLGLLPQKANGFSKRASWEWHGLQGRRVELLESWQTVRLHACRHARDGRKRYKRAR